MSYRIVTFFVDAKRVTTNRGARSTPAHLASRQQIELLHRSAQLQDGGVELTLLSDRKTALDGLQADVTIDRQNLDTDDLMLSRTRAQARFVEQYDFARPLAFLDFDILVNRPLSPIFSRSFDIGVTARNKAVMPVNGGVILANNRRPDAVRAFFRKFLETFMSRHVDEAAWWGDQRALNDMVLVDGADASRERETKRDGIDYLILPGRRYNHSPHILGLTLPLRRRSKFILHFKNESRKRFIAPYFALHLDRDGGSWPARVIRAYRMIGAA